MDSATGTSSGAGRRRVGIAVVGDVHNDWALEEDSKALQFLQKVQLALCVKLQPDLVLFTGDYDYGNENVQLVQSISDLQFPKEGRSCAASARKAFHADEHVTGYGRLSPDVEEGICQVLGHMCIESEIMAGSSSNIASTSSASSTCTSSKKRVRSQFDQKLGGFFKHQIESDTSIAYGDGFRAGHWAVLKCGLKRTLELIWLTGNFLF